MRFHTLRFLLPISIAVFTSMGCGDDSGQDAADQSLDGKGDTFTSTANKLTFTGSVNSTITLKKAFQCDAQQFMFMGGWHNQDSGSYDFPTGRISMSFNGGRLPNMGDVVELKGFDRLVFDGSGFNSEGGAGCSVKVAGILNEGKDGDFGINLEVQDCELVTGTRKVQVTGSLSCVGKGFEQLVIPGDPNPDDPNPDDPNPDDPTPNEPVVQTCSDAEYSTWMNKVLGLVDASNSSIDTSEQAAIDAALSEKPCTGVNEALYTAWATEFHDRLVRANSSIDANERKSLDIVLSIMPAAATDAAYMTWFVVFEEFIRKFLPTSTSTLDNDEKLFLELIGNAKPFVGGENGYTLWFDLTAEYFGRMAPMATSTLDNSEIENYDAMFAHKPVAGGGENYTMFREFFDAILNRSIPSPTSTVDSSEAQVLDHAAAFAPDAGSDGAYASWTIGFSDLLTKVGNRASDGGKDGLQRYVNLKPCVDSVSSTEVTDALNSLPELQGTDARSAYIAQATPTICQ